MIGCPRASRALIISEYPGRQRPPGSNGAPEWSSWIDWASVSSPPPPASPAVAGALPAARPRFLLALRVIFFLSGAAALIDQVVWTRALHRIVGVSAAAAATVLTAFMAGLAVGGFLFGGIADRARRPLRLYAGMELAIALFALLTPWLFRLLIPLYAMAAETVGADSAWLPVLRAALCMTILLPPTILMGGTLPVLVRGCLTDRATQPTAELYAVNTAGALLGCLAAGFILIGALGEFGSIMVASAGNLIAAAWAWQASRHRTAPTAASTSEFTAEFTAEPTDDFSPPTAPEFSSAMALDFSPLLKGGPRGVCTTELSPSVEKELAKGSTPTTLNPRLLLAVALSGGAIGVMLLPPGGSLSRRAVERLGQVDRHDESAEGTVTALTTREGNKLLLVNGVGMTTLCTDTRFMAHLPLMLHPNPRSVLVICLGMGTTFRSACRHDVSITAVELQPAAIRLFPWFHPDAPALLADPRRCILSGDGRNFLLLERSRYSVISIDPAPPMYGAGAVNLYTREFLALCRERLDESGVILLWVPNEHCLESDFRLVLRTFRGEFAHAQVWVGPELAGFYLIGSERPLRARRSRMRAVLDSPAVRADLCELLPHLLDHPDRPPIRLLLTNDEIDRYCRQETRTLTDDRPYTEFPLWRWLAARPDLRANWMRASRLNPYITRTAAGVFVDQ